jgi:hypothetical protein
VTLTAPTATGIGCSHTYTMRHCARATRRPSVVHTNTDAFVATCHKLAIRRLIGATITYHHTKWENGDSVTAYSAHVFCYLAYFTQLKIKNLYYLLRSYCRPHPCPHPLCLTHASKPAHVTMHANASTVACEHTSDRACVRWHVELNVKNKCPYQHMCLDSL